LSKPGSVQSPYDRIARFYDLTMAGFDADFDLYASELAALAPRAGRSVLELGTGTGRLVAFFARGGFETVGLDASPAMLALAERRTRGLQRLSLVRGDMRAPPLRGPFGLVVCSRDTFLHLQNAEDQLRTLRAARELLGAEGRLILDLPGPASDLADWEPGARSFVQHWSQLRPDGSRVSRLVSFEADLATQTQYVTDLYEEIAPDAVVRRTVVEYPLRHVFPAELELLLERAGLQLQARLGGYAGEPFDAASERMVVVATSFPV
jgi:SAM-dependent methyltransferase